MTQDCGGMPLRDVPSSKRSISSYEQGREKPLSSAKLRAKNGEKPFIPIVAVIDMDGMGSMPMGGMDMGDGVPGLFYCQRMYWACLGAAIGAFAVANLLNHSISFQRFRDRSATPAKPKNFLFVGYATLTAMAREVSYASLRPISLGPWKWYCPALGQVLLALANLIILMVFCFYKLDTADQWSWENIGYRTGFMSISQLPMIILLAGKNNWIGYLTGTSHERLNWFHRWFARILWLTATIHMCFWFRSWGRYDFIVPQLKENAFARTGFASWLVLTFILLTSSRPIRVYGYEIFLPLHLFTWAGFIAAVYYHAPDEVKAWVWVPIGLFCFDRLSRAALMVFTNIRFTRSSREKGGDASSWANKAVFAPLPGRVTRITITGPSFNWNPGSHIFLGCHTLAPFQSHPFTIASIPADGKLELLVRAEKGATKRFFEYATKNEGLANGANGADSMPGKMVVVEGPYGTNRNLRQFDSVVLIAGGIGATYTVPLMKDVIHGWKTAYSDSKNHIITRNLRFIWVIKSRAQLVWFETELRTGLRDVEEFRTQIPEAHVNLDISIYLTCDEALGSSSESQAETSRIPEEKHVSGVSTLNDISDSSLKLDEAEKPASEQKSPNTANLPKEFSQSISGSCGNGNCKCKRTVDDEDANEIRPCCCSQTPQSAPDNSSQVAAIPVIFDGAASASKEEHEPPRYTQETYPKYSGTEILANPLPQLRILTGRPNPRNIIRASLERARGESGVVACGPSGLMNDVQRAVTALSDERAVHKGTGAQGIYFHSEGFWY